MKFTTLVLAAAAAVASASPVVSANVTTTAMPVATLNPTVTYSPVDTLGPVVPKPVLPNLPGIQFCDNIVACVEELAGLLSTCAAAAAAGGMDVVGDIKCLVDAAESITKIPKACKGCL